MRRAIFLLSGSILVLMILQLVHAADGSWIEVSNSYTNQVLNVEMKHRQ